MITSKSSPDLISYGTPQDLVKPLQLHSTWKKVIAEPHVYLKGLPITDDIPSIKSTLTKEIFGQEPTLIDIFTDSEGKSTGKAYLEFENHNVKDIIKQSNGYIIRHDNQSYILLTNQCREKPQTGYTYIFLESYGVWRRNWTDEDIQEIES